MPGVPSRKRKDTTHERILGVAAKLVREHGVEGAGVDRVMGEAGLTRGGFYAHFDDRHAMVAEAIDVAFAQAKKNLFDFEPRPGTPWLDRATARYVSRAHVDAVGAGCAVPALSGEVARSAPRVREAFARNVAEILDLLALRLGGGTRITPRSRRRALALFSSWVGALAVARCVDQALGDEVLSAVRDAVLGSSTARARRAQRPAKELSSKPVPPNSSEAEPESTRASASSRKPARASARTSRSQA